MNTRQALALVAVCAGLSSGFAPRAAVFAQSPAQATRAQPDAATLYQQGMDQYHAGNRRAALRLLHQVDAMQLPRDQRQRYFKAMEQLDPQANLAQAAGGSASAKGGPAQATANLSAAALINRADHLADDHPDQAAQLYQQVLRRPDAGQSVKSKAAARLAQARRNMHMDLTQAKQQIDLANADIESGDLPSARNRLQNVQNSDVKLGWFDQQRLQRMLATVHERQGPSGGNANSNANANASTGNARGGGSAAEGGGQAGGRGQNPSQAGGSPPSDDLLRRVRVLTAQREAAEGKAAEQAGNVNLAISHYKKALQLEPKLDGVPDRLRALQSRAQAAGSSAGGRGPLASFGKVQALQNRRVNAQYNQLINQAQQALKAGNYPAAQDAALRAETVLDSGREYLSASQYKTKRRNAEQLVDRINKVQAQQQAAELAENQRQQKQAAQKSQREQEQRQREQVMNLLQRARELQKDQNYDQALQLVNQALYIEPTSVPAQFMQDVLQDSRVVVQQRRRMRLRDLNIAQQSSNNIEATIPYSKLIIYPADWPQLTNKREQELNQQNGGETKVNQQVAQKLRQPVPINFDANRLANVVDYLRNTTGLNFFVNWPAMQTAGVEKDTPISLQLNNVPADKALKLVLQQASPPGGGFGGVGGGSTIDYSVVDGIVTISTRQDLQNTTDVRSYDIRDLLVQVPNFSNAPQFDIKEALSNTNSGGGGGGGGGGGNESNLFGNENQNQQNQETTPTRKELITQISDLIRNTVGQSTDWRELGGNISSVRELNGQLIIKTTPDNQRQIQSLLDQLRETRAIQISVEARFLLVDQNFLEEVGFDLDINIPADTIGGNFGPIGIAQDSFGLARRISTNLTPDRFNSDSDNNGPGQFTPGRGFPDSGRALDFGVSYLDDLEVNLLVRATQADQRAITLTAPRVTFFNGQRAYVLVVRQLTFISDLQPIPNAAGFDPTVSVVNSGAVLDVEGTISSDRRYVTLTLRPSLATVQQPIRQVQLTGSTNLGNNNNNNNNGGNNITTFTGFIELPALQLTQARATVSVPDKGTLLLGGQRLVSETEVESGVPVLSKIPVINRFFTNTSTVKDQRTLLILVRPTIIIQSEAEGDMFPGLVQGSGKYNAGRSSTQAASPAAPATPAAARPGQP